MQHTLIPIRRDFNTLIQYSPTLNSYTQVSVSDDALGWRGFWSFHLGFRQHYPLTTVAALNWWESNHRSCPTFELCMLCETSASTPVVPKLGGRTIVDGTEYLIKLFVGYHLSRYTLAKNNILMTPKVFGQTFCGLSFRTSATVDGTMNSAQTHV